MSTPSSADLAVDIDPSDSFQVPALGKRNDERESLWSSVALVSVETAKAGDKPLENQLTPLFKKRKDPLIILPLEVVEIIFSHLRYKQLIQMLQVSRSWNKALHGVRPVINNLQFSGCFSNRTSKMLRAALDRCKVPKSVTIRYLTPDLVTMFKQKFQSWRMLENLEYLYSSSCQAVGWLSSLRKTSLKELIIYEEEVPMSWVASILQECPTLTTFEVHTVIGGPSNFILNSSTLQNLDIRMKGQNHQLPTTDHLFSCLPRLKRLECSDLSLNTWTSTLDLSNTRLTDLIFTDCTIPNLRLPLSLRHLSLNVQAIDLPSSGESFPALDNLESLHFANSLNSCYPEFLIQAAEKTKSGKLFKCQLFQEPFTHPQFSRLYETEFFKNVEDLELTCTRINDSDSPGFISMFSNLRNVAIVFDTNITGAFIKALIGAEGSKIEWISVEHCKGVAEDTVQWAKAHGVTMYWC